jgi:hypothetical protein
MTTENILKIKDGDYTVAIRASIIRTIKLVEDKSVPEPVIQINIGDEVFYIRRTSSIITLDQLLGHWISKWESMLRGNSEGVFIES